MAVSGSCLARAATPGNRRVAAAAKHSPIAWKQAHPCRAGYRQSHGVATRGRVCDGVGMADSSDTTRAGRDAHTKPYCVNPFPDTGGLYLLIAGIVLGVLLGPAVLGRAAPGVYLDVFVGGGEYLRQLNEENEKTQRQIEALENIDVTGEAIPEQVLGREQELVVLKAQLDQAQRQRIGELTGWTTALMLAVIAVMMVESLVGPELKAGVAAKVPPAVGRLITARYALAALWIAVVLARPQLLTQVPILFAAGLVVVALGAALVPLGNSAKGDR